MTVENIPSEFLLGGDVSPLSFTSDAEQGTLYIWFGSTGGSLWQKQDSVPSSNWQQVGSSSVVSQTVVAGGSILAGNSYVEVSAAAPVVLGTPSIVNGPNTDAGETLTIVNVGSNTITINNSASVINPGGASVGLASKSSISYIWSATLTAWVCTSYSNN
jgi:hypothetical protein